MSEVKKQSQSDKYLVAHEYEPNEHGAFIYTSTSGNHKVEMSAALEDYHYESSKDNVEEVDTCNDRNSALGDEKDSLEQELEELSSRLEGFTATNLLDEKRLEILRRMYKHLSLDDLEAVEAPFKLRTGYLDINY